MLEFSICFFFETVKSYKQGSAKRLNYWEQPMTKNFQCFTNWVIQKEPKNLVLYCRVRSEICVNYCRILKSSFNNSQRRIESLQSFSNHFSNSFNTTPLNACTRSTRQGISGGSTKKIITPEEKTSLMIRRLGCGNKRGSILILLLKGLL